MPHEADQRQGADHPVGDDLARVEPIEPLPALEHRLQRPDPRRQEDEPNVVHALSSLLKTRVLNEAQRQCERQHADRDVDVENPRPAEGVRDVAAERGAERGAHHHADAEDRHRGAELLAWKFLIQDRLRGGKQRAATQPLNDAPEHKRAEGVRIAAKER